MSRDKDDLLVLEIERIRKELHQKVGGGHINNHEVLMNEDLLELSRTLDKLILEFMNRKQIN